MVQHSWQQLNAMKLEDLEKLQKSLRASTLRRIRNLAKAGLVATPATAGLARKADKGVIPKIARIEDLGKSVKTSKPKKVKTAKIPSTKVKKVTPPKIPAPKPTAFKKSDIIRQIMEYEKFLSSKTSTVRGAKDFNNSTDTRLGDMYTQASPEQRAKFWALYDEIRDEVENTYVDSDRIQRAVVVAFIGKGYKRITSKRMQEVRDILDSMLTPMDNPFNQIGQFKR